MITRPPRVRAAARNLAAVVIAAAIVCGSFGADAQRAARGTARDLAPLRDYIKRSWTTLTRSNRDLPAAAPDPKFHEHRAGTPWPVYLPAAESRERVETELKTLLSSADLQAIDLRTLPSSPVTEPGLLYLPRPYVVPGGRFNEMYGWDSYFIQVGLLRDGEIERARDMVDNFVYEIDNYGTILNANRTYYLTRSQPPFLTEMILGVFERTHDRAWLEKTWPAVEQYYKFWTTEPHLIPGVGLSRYFDAGEGPAPEVLADERDAAGRTHYDRVREYYKTHEVSDYDVGQYYDRAADRLTPLFYKGDRSMRESGFDPSNRFGPFNIDIIHYAPVCLNALLYRMEREAGDIARTLGRADAAAWDARAAARRTRIDRYLWDPASGLYLDYNVQTRRRRHYPFATTFYPLWTGAASPQQARRVAANLAAFEAPGGILTSTRVTGNQWDAPYGWAPLQMIAVGGLRRYGEAAAADRIARKFVDMVADDFTAHGTIVEKYDVRRRSSDLGAGIRFGYAANQVGFGWTNGVLLELLAGLAPAAAASRAPPLAPFVRSGDEPILSPQGDGFESAGVFNPAVIRRGAAYTMIYRAQDRAGVSRLGSATSRDGLTFRRRPDPIFVPDAPYEQRGVEDPRLVEIDGRYWMTYTAYDGTDAQLALASSADLEHWERHGVILPANRGRWNVHWTKSGAILPTKVNGRYWMYYMADAAGAFDQLGVAESTDLLHWTESLDAPLLARRPGFFDSRVVEPGPPPVLTDAGILLIYNGADDRLVYSTGWALFDRTDPTKLIARSDRPIFRAERPWERIGQVPNVVFVEGLVRDGARWLVYYGAADKYIGAAVTGPR